MNQPQPLIRIHLRGAADVEAERNMVSALIASINAEIPVDGGHARLAVVDPLASQWRDAADPGDTHVFDLLLGIVWMDLPDALSAADADSEMEAEFMHFADSFLRHPAHVMRYLFFNDAAPDRLIGKQRTTRLKVETLRGRIGASLTTRFYDIPELRARLVPLLGELMTAAAELVASQHIQPAST